MFLIMFLAACAVGLSAWLGTRRAQPIKLIAHYEQIVASQNKTISIQTKTISAQSVALITSSAAISELQKQLAAMEEMFDGDEIEEDDDEEEDRPKPQAATANIVFRKLTQMHDKVKNCMGADHVLTKELEKIIDESQS